MVMVDGLWMEDLCRSTINHKTINHWNPAAVADTKGVPWDGWICAEYRERCGGVKVRWKGRKAAGHGSKGRQTPPMLDGTAGTP